MKHRRLSLALALLGASAANAAVIRSGFVDLAIPTDFDGIYIDIDGNTSAFSDFVGADINPFFGGSEIATNPSFLPVRAGTGAFDAILNLPRDTILDGTTPSFSAPVFGGSLTHLGTGPAPFQTSQVGYVGFQFMTNATPGPISGPFFGWMEVRFTPNTPGGVIQQWAFENTGAAIVVPEPSTYTVLTGVAVLCLALRRRRHGFGR